MYLGANGVKDGVKHVRRRYYEYFPIISDVTLKVSMHFYSHLSKVTFRP